VSGPVLLGLTVAAIGLLLVLILVPSGSPDAAPSAIAEISSATKVRRGGGAGGGQELADWLLSADRLLPIGIAHLL